MSREVFKRFAIYAWSYYGMPRHSYTILCDLEKRSLVYRDTSMQKWLDDMARDTIDIDMAKAYSKAAAKYQGKEFVRAFELSDDDMAAITPLLDVDRFIKAKEHAASYDPTEDVWWIVADCRTGFELGFEGYTGTETPLFQVKNTHEYRRSIPQVEELHQYLVNRFRLWRLPGAGFSDDIPRSKHNKKRHKSKRR